MRTIKDILDFFEEFAPLETAADFDNAGLLIGDFETKVRCALVSLDITSAVVDEAVERGCELIISHHPVIFNPIKRLNQSDVVYRLVRGGVSAVCMHTNLDMSERFGVNTCLAQALGVKRLVRSNKGECLFCGELESKISPKELARRAKLSLDCEGARYTEARAEVQKIALCSGAGGSEIFAAAEEGADVLVTGEIKHHEIIAANELGISIIDVGHFKSEDIVINPLVSLLSQKFEDIDFAKSSLCTDKIKFI